jgi:hypothetical protein
MAMRWMMIEKVPRVAAFWGQFCFAAKSLFRPVWTGCLTAFSDLGPIVIQRMGQGALPGPILSRSVRVVGGTLLGDTQPSVLDACGHIDCPCTCIIDFYIEHVAFYLGPLTLCGECYGAYMCILDRAVTTDSDGTGACTLVYAIGCAWASVAMPYRHREMSAPVPKAAVLAMCYPKSENPRVGWLDAWVTLRPR